jgi:hypothetical protein
MPAMQDTVANPKNNDQDAMKLAGRIPSIYSCNCIVKGQARNAGLRAGPRGRGRVIPQSEALPSRSEQIKPGPLAGGSGPDSSRLRRWRDTGAVTAGGPPAAPAGPGAGPPVITGISAMMIHWQVGRAADPSRGRLGLGA